MNLINGTTRPASQKLRMPPVRSRACFAFPQEFGRSRFTLPGGATYENVNTASFTVIAGIPLQAGDTAAVKCSPATPHHLLIGLVTMTVETVNSWTPV